MRTLVIFGALLAMTVAAQAQLNPEQQAEAQQQAINKLGFDNQNCQRMYQGQLNAGVNPQQALAAKNKCFAMAKQNYETQLSRIGLTGSTAACTRPDGCGVQGQGQNGQGQGGKKQPRPQPQPQPECCRPGQGHLPTGQ